MRAIIDGTQIYIQNFNREPELPIFEAVVEALKTNEDFNSTRETIGPDEIYVTTKYQGSEVLLEYDDSFGFMPIQCTKDNVEAVFDVVSRAIEDFTLG